MAKKKRKSMTRHLKEVKDSLVQLEAGFMQVVEERDRLLRTVSRLQQHVDANTIEIHGTHHMLTESQAMVGRLSTQLSRHQETADLKNRPPDVVNHNQCEEKRGL